MIFRSLRIENLLSHEETDLKLEPLSVIRGANGSGKSTIVSALQALASGTADCTDDRGAGIRELIRAGTEKASVAVEVEDGGETRKVRIAITEKSGRMPSCSKESDPSYTGKDYLASLALRADVLEILINSKSFFGKGDAKAETRQKELLASIILPATVEFEKGALAAIDSLGLAVKRDLKPFDFVATAYDAAYRERTAVNRAIKDWKEPAKPSEPPAPVEEIRKKLGERQEARIQAALRKQALISTWSRANDERTRQGSKLANLKAKLQAELNRKNDVGPVFTKAALANFEKEAKNLDLAIALDKEIAARSVEIEVLARQLTAVQKLLKDDDAKCPTCQQAIGDETREALYLPIQRQFDQKNTDQRADFEKRKTLGDPAKAQKLVEEHKTALSQTELIDRHIAEVEKDIAEIQKAMESELPAQPDTTTIDAEIADLDARIEKGNAALQKAITAESEKKYYDQQIGLKAGWEKTLATLEKLVTYFGPSGVQAKLLDESIGPFEAKMNEILLGWGFAAKLKFDPYEFRVGFTGHDGWYSLKTISASQRAMFAVAFQVALAKTTGNNFVVVDAADIFLDANRIQLYKNLMRAGLDQVIVLQSDTRREIPNEPNSAFYMLSLDASATVPKTVVERL